MICSVNWLYRSVHNCSQIFFKVSPVPRRKLIAQCLAMASVALHLQENELVQQPGNSGDEESNSTTTSILLLNSLLSLVPEKKQIKRYKVNPTPPLVAALPSYRLQPGLPAFAHTGVDYFGPIEVVMLRRRIKRWGCLFTCLNSRAVHMEMAYSLDTDSFISVMSRFESRRGVPASYYSDNGTNFVGAQRELKECLNRLDQTAITGHLIRKGVEWHFNPPSAPHFGGSWERLIRSAKKRARTYLEGPSLDG